MAEIGKYAADLAKTILSFGSMGTVGWLAAALFSILVGVGGFFLARWARQYRIDEANKKTEQGRSQASSDVANEGREVEQDSDAAADEIDRIGRKP